jgi:hypothetical protein
MIEEPIQMMEEPIQMMEEPIQMMEETLHDAFVSMFENIIDYIHTENSITRIMIELYT